ncbi:MAG TPA: tetratricopeptide repeat protein, partial [Pyrinomonadaceae bacterium]|nr:tetratricopeptide repeat protein [Pyrinomonadaceae bacterium]
GDKDGEADCYMVIGRIYFSFRELQNAYDNFASAIEIYRSQKNFESEAEALNNIGAVLRENGQFEKAIQNYSLAYSLEPHVKKTSVWARICNGLGESYLYSGNLAEAKTKLLEAEKYWQTIPGNEDKVRTNYNLAKLYLATNETEKGVGLLNRALTESRQFDNPVLEGDILESLADYYYTIGEIPKSLELRRQITNAFQNSKAFNVTRYRLLVAISKLITTFRAVGDFISAFQYCEVALPIAREEGELRMIASLLLSKGEILSDQGQYTEAISTFNESLAIVKKENIKDLEPNILESLARANYESGNLRQAESYLTQMAQILAAQPDEFNEPYLYAGLIITYTNLQDMNKVDGLIRLAQSKKLDVGKQEGNLRLGQAIGFAQLMRNQNQEGLETLKNVYDATAKIGHEVEKARVSYILSVAYAKNGDLPNALRYAQSSHDFWKKIGNDQMDMKTHLAMGTISLQLNQMDNAVGNFNSAYGLAQKIDDNKTQAIALYNIGVTYRQFQSYPRAIEYFNQSLSVVENLGDTQLQKNILNDLGDTYEKSGDKKKAKEFRDKAKKIK